MRKAKANEENLIEQELEKHIDLVSEPKIKSKLKENLLEKEIQQENKTKIKTEKKGKKKVNVDEMDVE